MGKDVGIGDFRTCWIDTNETSSRFKPWLNIEVESTQETFSDSVVSCPVTVLPVGRKMLQNGGDPKRYFAEWAEGVV